MLYRSIFAFASLFPARCSSNNRFRSCSMKSGASEWDLLYFDHALIMDTSSCHFPLTKDPCGWDKIWLLVRRNHCRCSSGSTDDLWLFCCRPFLLLKLLSLLLLLLRLSLARWWKLSDEAESWREGFNRSLQLLAPSGLRWWCWAMWKASDGSPRQQITAASRADFLCILRLFCQFSFELKEMVMMLMMIQAYRQIL